MNNFLSDTNKVEEGPLINFTRRVKKEVERNSDFISSVDKLSKMIDSDINKKNIILYIEAFILIVLLIIYYLGNNFFLSFMNKLFIITSYNKNTTSFSSIVMIIFIIVIVGLILGSIQNISKLRSKKWKILELVSLSKALNDEKAKMLIQRYLEKNILEED